MAKVKRDSDRTNDYMDGYNAGRRYGTKSLEAQLRIHQEMIGRMAQRHRQHILLAVLAGQVVTIATYFAGLKWL